MISNTRNQLERWLKTIEIDGNHIADIGAAQNTLKGRTKTWNPDSYVIFDLEQPHETRVNDWVRLDIQKDKITKKSIYYHGFDTVFMLEVSEYLFDPLSALKNVNNLLEKDGLFYSSWHLLYPRHKPLGLDYLRYTPEGAERLLRETGFDIIENIPRIIKDDESIGELDCVYGREGMRGWRDFDISDIGSLITARKK
jgi:SAM-dependent methyltransferase